MAAENKKTTSPESIDALKKEFNDITNKIRQLLAGKKDKNEISTEDRNKLRQEYSKAAQKAKQISTRTTDTEEAKKFKDFFEKLSNEAANYGSVMNAQIPETTFDDVKGLEDVKKLVKSFLFMAQNPKILEHYKIKGGLGMMMYGAPGTGKTMFAEAIAHEMKLPLFIVTPADIFKSYVGESEQAVKQLFLELDACPDGAILFIDECESIFSRRTQDTKDYKAAVTTELLQRINGFGVNGAKRIMIAATNRPDVIDPAYLRYKRFSHLVHVTPPDKEAKKAIIEGKIKGIELHGITTDQILEMTEQAVPRRISNDGDRCGYYSAADICGIIEEACRLALEQIQESGSTEPIPLTKEMFVKAFKKTPPSISQDLLDEYNDFRSSIND